jgi:hypothetical protein
VFPAPSVQTEKLSAPEFVIPLNYLVPVHDHPLGDDRPNLKCPGCGTRYRWQLRLTGDPPRARAGPHPWRLPGARQPGCSGGGLAAVGYGPRLGFGPKTCSHAIFGSGLAAHCAVSGPRQHPALRPPSALLIVVAPSACVAAVPPRRACADRAQHRARTTSQRMRSAAATNPPISSRTAGTIIRAAIQP